MQEGRRAARVGRKIQEELSGMLLRGVKDPRLDMVSITGVDVTDDLQFAKIFFCVFGDEQKKSDAACGFKSASGFIKKELGLRLGLRKVPEIAFEFDTSFDRGEKIEKLLKIAGVNEHPIAPADGDQNET